MSLTLVRRYALTLGLVIALSGCVGSLLGGGKPDRLYRFGPTASAAASAPIGQPARVLAVPPPQFAPDIGGDRILTVAGQDNAYLKDMRWVSPAPTLYAGTIETTLAERAPDMIVATGNGWWTAGTSIVGIQRASAEAWARLFGVPLVMAFNM